MTHPRSHRSGWLALLVSALLHLAVLFLGGPLSRRAPEPQVYPVWRPAAAPPVAERLQTRPAPSVPPKLIERLRTEATDPTAWDEAPEIAGVPGVGPLMTEPPPLEPDDDDVPARREAFPGVRDAPPAPPPGVRDPVAGIPRAQDLLEMDAFAREYTTVLVDPVTGRLQQAWLHIPVFVDPSVAPRSLFRPRPGAKIGASGIPGSRAGVGGEDGGPPIVGIELFYIQHGAKLPYPVPIEIERRYYPMGYKLHHTEMARYPVINLNWIDVESTEAAVQYLLDGGLFIAQHFQMDLLERALRQHLGPQAGERVERVTLGPGHPISHAFYNIDRHWVRCPPVCPVPGLKLDGRLVAVVSPRFNRYRSDTINQLYVNVLVHALTQPSTMGGHYVVAGGRVDVVPAEPHTASAQPQGNDPHPAATH